MNKTFKVARSLTRGTVVTSEKASSYQGKAVKTVIAAAVASLVAGAAMAAEVAGTVDITGSLAISTANSATTYKSSDVNKTTTGADGASTTASWDDKTDTLGAGSKVVLANGLLSVANTETTTVDSIDGTGTVTVDASTANTTLAEDKGFTQKHTHTALDINMTAADGDKGAATKATLTLSGSDTRVFASGTLKTTTATSEKHVDAGSAELKFANGTLQLGVADELATNDTLVTPGTDYNFDIGLNTTVTAGKVDYQKGNIKVAEGKELSLAAITTIGEGVVFANAGTVTLSGASVNFNADYAAEQNSGKLVVNGTTETNIGGAITGGEVRLADNFNQKDGKTDDAAFVLLQNGATVKNGGSINATKLTFAGNKTLTVNGAVETAATVVSASGAKVTIRSENVSGKNVFGTANLGAITIEDVATTAADFTLTNTNSKVDVTAESLTIEAAVADPKTEAGTFTLAQGGLTLNTVTNHGTVKISDSQNQKAGLTLASGASTNAGTISLGTSGSLTIAKDAVLTNASGGSVGEANTSGSISVAGQLINYTAGATADKDVNGKISAEKLTIAEGGLVSTTLAPANYDVGTTTIAEGGVLKTALNVQADGTDPVPANKKPATALGLTTNFVLAGGTITDRNDAVISDFVVNAATASLAVTADQELKSVYVKSGAFSVASGAAVTVGDLSIDNTTGNSATVSGASNLTIGKLTTKGTDGILTVKDGTVTTTLHGIGLKAGTSNILAEDSSSGAGKVIAKTIQLNQNGTLVLTDYAESDATFTKDTINTQLIGKLATDYKGVIDLGNVTVSGVDADDETGRFAYTDMIKGLTTTAYKSASVETNTIDRSESYGNIYTTGTDLTVSTGTLTLNKATEKEGFLVWHEVTSGTGTSATKTPTVSNVKLGDSGALVVTTTGEVGSVTKTADTVTGTKLSVTADGNLTTKTINVDDLNVDGKLTIAGVESGSGYTVATGTLNVGEDATFSAAANDVTVSNTRDYYNSTEKTFNDEVSTIAGTAVVNNLTISGDMLVTNSLKVNDTLTTNSKTLFVGTDEAAGTVSVAKLGENSTIFADPEFGTAPSKVAVGYGAVSSSAKAGRNAILSLGTTDTAEFDETDLLEQTGFTLAETTDENDNSSYVTRTVNSVLYVTGTDTYLGRAEATDDVASDTNFRTQADVYVAGNSMLAFDANKVNAKGEVALFDKDVTIDSDAVVYIANAANGQQFKLSAGKLNGDHGFSADTVFQGDALMEVKDVEDTSSTITIGMQKDLNKIGFTGAAAEMAYAYFEEGANLNNTSKSAEFLNALLSSYSSPFFNSKDDIEFDYAGIVSALNAGAALGATTGVQTMTMDAVNQMADTVADRTSVLTQRGQGVNIWADVNGGKFEAKTLFDGAGYSSDIYSGVLGLDYQFSCNAVLGAALMIGTADTDSKNSAFKASTDSDLVGFSVYASKTFADIWNVSADIGYLQASNEVKADGYGFNYKFDQDTDAFTVGVRGEVLTKAGSVNIVPHVGLCYTALSTDGFEAAYVTDIDDQNIFQMPVGVTVSADFETNGWTIAPKFDLSVVPTFGDKDADLKLGVTGASATTDYAVRVIDSNPVQAQLGVNATNGAWGFGLNYKLGVGSDDRMNNSFNANVRYAF